MNSSQMIDMLGGTTAVAKRIDARLASVSEWRRNGIPVARLIELGAEIQAAGGPKRWDLRPDDWHLIWPELVGIEGAPAVPEMAAMAAEASDAS